ncbi:hypothetical protein G7046_g458 [Stylonectria norvegica]|nr:hypothetical protein G7046_g458 [Stylonectria norvegica]
MAVRIRFALILNTFSPWRQYAFVNDIIPVPGLALVCRPSHRLSRMKCDEARPACGRCVRAKTECPGYQKAIKWSRKHEFHSEFVNTQQQLSQGSSSSRSPVLQKATGTTARDTTVSNMEENPGDLAADLMSQYSNPISGSSPDIYDWLGDLQGVDLPRAYMDSADASQHLLSIGLQRDSPSIWFEPDAEHDFQQDMAPPSAKRDRSMVQFEPQKTPQPQTTEQNNSGSMILAPSSVMAGLTDTTTLLADFYFQETARSFSVYDGVMNPFRSLVARLWSQSRVIYCAMQSMAATGVESLYPALGPIGRELRQEAVTLLMANEDCAETSLLALLMIGASSSWHDPTDSGVALFNSFQSRMQRVTAKEDFLENSSNYRFFHESLVYWQMLLSFVVDGFRMGSYQRWAGPMSGPMYGSSGNSQAPHPWTGVGHEVQMTLCDIGHVIRSQRQQARYPVVITQDHIDRLQNSILKAFELEDRLLRMTFPSEDRIISPADRDTPVQHLLKFAQIYRLVGLLQIYRVFPDILWQRLQSPLTDLSTDIHSFFESVSRHTTRWNDESGYLAHNLERRDLGSWLTTFALNILELFKQVPVESGTRAFQPFLLVACGSELRVPPQSKLSLNSLPFGLPPQTSAGEISDMQFMPEMSLRAVEVIRARGMVLGRLETLLRLLPPKPHMQCIFVVKEIWRKMDAGAATIPRDESTNFGEGSGDAVFWMDVMIENGWETIMG